MPDSLKCPIVSVVFPFGTDTSLTATGLCSVFMQKFTDFELLVVVDGPVNEPILTSHTEQGSQYRVIRAQTKNMLPCARNAALREARGNFITYLDPGDEYYLDYLSLVAQFHDKADILVFGYDLLQKDVPGSDRVHSLNPSTMKDDFFVKNIAPPLGIAHRRDLFGRVGGFNELLNRDDDWDLWKRFARAGAEFAFLPYKSGRQHGQALVVERALTTDEAGRRSP